MWTVSLTCLVYTPVTGQLGVAFPSLVARSEALGKTGAPLLKYTNSKGPGDSSSSCPRVRQAVFMRMKPMEPYFHCKSNMDYGGPRSRSLGPQVEIFTFFRSTIKSQAAGAEATKSPAQNSLRTGIIHIPDPALLSPQQPTCPMALCSQIRSGD